MELKSQLEVQALNMVDKTAMGGMQGAAVGAGPGAGAMGGARTGAGGGRMWMEETRGTRINAERTRQALETGAATVATSCPFCMTMMKDGLADAAAGAGAAASGAVSARDIAEILADVIEPDPIPASRRLPVLN